MVSHRRRRVTTASVDQLRTSDESACTPYRKGVRVVLQAVPLRERSKQEAPKTAGGGLNIYCIIWLRGRGWKPKPVILLKLTQEFRNNSSMLISCAQAPITKHGACVQVQKKIMHDKDSGRIIPAPWET